MVFKVMVECTSLTLPNGEVIHLFWQSRVRPQEFTKPSGSEWEIAVLTKGDLWSGPCVGKNPDGRRFVYLAWLTQEGRIHGRIKLYQDQVTGPLVKLTTVLPNGSPAFSTARVE
jgi:hypothetical protein